jgi:zinc-ribbon domain
VATICQMCGMSNDDEIQFCSACGSPLTAGASRTESSDGPVPDQDSPAKTMMFNRAPVLSTQPKKKAAPVAKTPQMETNKTVFGMPAVGGQVASSKPVQAVQVQAKPVQTKPVQAKPVQAKPVAKKPADNAHTVLGMAAVTPQMVQEAKEATPKAAVPIAAPKPAEQKLQEADFDKKTVLGMPAAKDGDSTPVEEPSAARAAPKPAPSQDIPGDKAPKEKPEEVGKPAPVEHSPTPVANEGSPAAGNGVDGSMEDDWEDDDTSTGGGGRGLIIALIVAGVLVVIGAVALIYLLAFGKGKAIEPQLFRTSDGNAITVAFSFPEAPMGTTIQVLGQTVQVSDNQARLDIPIANIKLGTNEIPLVYLEPGQSPENLKFNIAMRHTISTDLSGLAAEEPFVSVGFNVAEGIALAIEGKPIQLVGGVHTHKVLVGSLQAGVDEAADNISHKINFQLTDAKGGAEQGQQLVTIPLTKLQIDRPAEKAVVASPSVTCAGVAENGAQITVNGKPVGVTAIGFMSTVPMPSLGEHKINVTARAPGKAPRQRTVTVTRIDNLDGAIEQWSKDVDKGMDYPTIGRDPNAHVGKKVKLNGRVVNINTEKGVTAFLLYIASGCPAGARCAVYVVYRGETEAGLQSWVDVFGTVRGTRAVDLPNGQKLEVPAVDAQFVIKTKKKTAPKRKRRR